MIKGRFFIKKDVSKKMCSFVVLELDTSNLDKVLKCFIPVFFENVRQNKKDHFYKKRRVSFDG